MYEFRLYFNDILLLSTFNQDFRAFFEFCEYCEEHFEGVAYCKCLLNGKTVRGRFVGLPPKEVYNPNTRKWYSFEKFCKTFHRFPKETVEKYRNYIIRYGL